MTAVYSPPIVERLSLVDEDSGDELVLMPSDDADGLWLTDLDLGFPDIRDVVEPRAGGDGTVDHTSRFGARTVTAQFVATGGIPAVNRLRAWMHPARRPLLRFTPAGGAAQQFHVRTAGHASPVLVLARRGIVELSVQWRVPDGRAYSVAEHVEQVSPVSPEEGRTYPLVYDPDRVYPFTGGLGTATVVNEGTAPVWPVWRAYGPCTAPRFGNDSTGEVLEFTDALVVADGSFVEVDTQARTVRIDGVDSVSANRRQTLDFGASSWWQLAAGSNVVRFYPRSFSAGCTAEVVWRHGYL